MYLKEIKTFGFKSFADKINIEFSPNINGIVGPNGSGKSNIVDAISWVLGEQSIKSLRGETNTDIIFSGSKSRKPLNSAMVALVFDNSDHHLPIDYNEVEIKRVSYRAGDNEFYINNEFNHSPSFSYSSLIRDILAHLYLTQNILLYNFSLRLYFY